MILQEMMRAARPIVASHVGGIPAMTGQDATLLVPARDAGALARAVETILGSAELATRLATAASERATRLPTGQDALTHVTHVYRSLLT
jgi:glycosyltransferase involved in cell wall biosynthesis